MHNNTDKLWFLRLFRLPCSEASSFHSIESVFNTRGRFLKLSNRAIGNASSLATLDPKPFATNSVSYHLSKNHRRPLPAPSPCNGVLSGRLTSLLVVLGSLGVSACSSPNPPSPSVEPGKQETLDSFSIPIRDRDSSTPLDPRADGWDSEAFGEEAQQQVKQLVKYLMHPEEIQPQRLAPLVSDHFSCGPLHPDNATTLFAEGAIVVTRSTPSDEQAEPPFIGATGLAEALQRLAEPFREASAVRSKVKTVGVQLAESTYNTNHLIEVSGEQAGGMVELHLGWNCVWHRDPTDGALRLQALHPQDYEKARLNHPGKRLFVDCTQAVLSGNDSFAGQLLPGLNYWMERLDMTQGIGSAGHHGLALGDVNGDGLEDIYLCQPGGLPNRLYVQQPDGTVRDVSAAAGVDWLDACLAALLIDLDNDGDQDLVVTGSFGILAMANDGQGHFQTRASFGGVLAVDERSELGAGLAAGRGGHSLAAADYDHDGDLDLYICRYANKTSIPLPSLNHATNGSPNSLFRNDLSSPADPASQWIFTDVTAEVGMNQNNHCWSMAVAWEDYDNDHDLDLYVANDFGPNNLYRNEGGKFLDVAEETGAADFRAGMSVSWGDYNRDGWMDLYIGNMFSAAGNRIAFQHEFQTDGDDHERRLFQGRASGNSLYQNTGEHGFKEVSQTAAVAMGRWSWSSNFVDLNNDGWEDLVVGNGFYSHEDSADL